MNESSGTVYHCGTCGMTVPQDQSHECPGKFGSRLGWLDGIGTVRACLDCGVLVAGGLTRCMNCAQRVGPEFTVEYDPAAGKPMRYKIEIRELPAGSVFETDDGAQAVKSKYKLRPNDPDSPTMSIIIGSGEFFHSDQGDDELVIWIA